MAKSFLQLIGIPPSTASVTDSSLIIIDAQNEYKVGHLKTENVDQTGAAIKSLLEKYRAAGKQKNVVHILHRTPDGAPVFTQGTELAEEFKELTPQEGEKVIWKQHPSSFAGTGLHEYLQELGASGKKIVLTGYMAHVCVSTTTRHGAELGYEILVARDAVGDRHIPGQNAEQLVDAVMAELGDAFATIVTGADIK